VLGSADRCGSAVCLPEEQPTDLETIIHGRRRGSSDFGPTRSTGRRILSASQLLSRKQLSGDTEYRWILYFLVEIVPGAWGTHLDDSRPRRTHPSPDGQVGCCGGSSQSDEIHPADTVQQTVEESLTWRPASIPQASSRSRLVKQCLKPPTVESLPLLWPREAPVDEMSRVPCSEPALSSIRPGPWCARIWPWLASIASNLRVASGIRHWLAPRLPPPAPPLSNSPAPRTPVRKLILSSLQLTRLVDTLG
jgi:hypothetical protein